MRVLSGEVDVAGNERLRSHEACVAEWEQLQKQWAAPLGRVSRGHEREAERRRDLDQEIWVAIWRALPSRPDNSPLGPWALTVAHHAALAHAAKHARRREKLRTLEELEAAEPPPAAPDADGRLDRLSALQRLEAWIQGVAPLDRQLLMLSLEGLGPSELAPLVGLSANHVAVKLSRLRKVMARDLAPRTPTTPGGDR